MLNYYNNSKHWLLKSLAFLLAFALTAINYSDFMCSLRSMPSAYYVESADELDRYLSNADIPNGITVSVSSSYDESLENCDCTLEYRLFGFLPIKSSSAHIGKRAYLVPCGQPVGISIFTEGVLIVGLGSFKNVNGARVAPAADAGLLSGDIILTACDIAVSTSSQLQQVIDANPGGVVLLINRNGKRLSMTVKPQLAYDNGVESGYRIGAWIRDSTVGIGTLTYYDTENGSLAALGHAVVDADTGTHIAVKDGQLVLADLLGVTKGTQGSPGELHGTFSAESFVLGTVKGNTELGICGDICEQAKEILPCQPLAVAFPNEVHVGSAAVLASVNSEGPKAYSCRIIKTGAQDSPAQKGLVIQIDDDELIEKTGGIVQGMSGCPIVQDGRLVGVVTHVFVNDPLRGYGAYAYWMYKVLNG